MGMDESLLIPQRREFQRVCFFFNDKLITKINRSEAYTQFLGDFGLISGLSLQKQQNLIWKTVQKILASSTAETWMLLK